MRMWSWYVKFGNIDVSTNDSKPCFKSNSNCLKSDGTSEIAESWTKNANLLYILHSRLTNMVAFNTKKLERIPFTQYARNTQINK
ncbi:hypothetical protein METBIDRAFT_113431 [Metschnikowia bicuspidata var. bicuspidata NRRL YB-4993]|uniref:Uncharacterized protein n=1 Tax=Metschnikowia bicuspidata var. bicuspidata NRRL YB-4993 TaxID=869754 RepID=A0A1A0HI21_9ASCO|nr:hypothetical protein METBIDRAFT_113431 [Metschnikowia bicuspidata var. bicuspidata NRRL YB-4993]OBA23809.1 hypothetical protein METBIDRAFT_113431 [Metschnikowia bicuspidata var. bicuspidata NRRL YB-4993]